MGCDYYVDKNLYIYDHNDASFTFINLEKISCYYSYSLLLDDVGETEYVKHVLEPFKEPILIFNNNTFSDVSFEQKYKKIIECELKTCNKQWEDVNKIIQTEETYVRW